MSLRGRYVIDRIKRAVSHRLILPCPPYGQPTYWEGVYKKLGPQDVFEWGNLRLENDLLHHRYDGSIYSGHLEKYGYGSRGEGDTEEPMEDSDRSATTFGEAIGVHPGETGKRVILLGCGNSKIGEDMIDHDWCGPIIQVDVAKKVIMSMTERCAPYMTSGEMDCVQDDATSLTAFEDTSIDSVVDKGLIDALFCANRSDQVGKIMWTTNRVLKPGGVFAFFSFSRPEFLLSEVMEDKKGRVKGTKLWKDVQIRALDTILMYRFIKGAERAKPTDLDRRSSGYGHKRAKRSRSRRKGQ